MYRRQAAICSRFMTEARLHLVQYPLCALLLARLPSIEILSLGSLLPIKRHSKSWEKNTFRKMMRSCFWGCKSSMTCSSRRKISYGDIKARTEIWTLISKYARRFLKAVSLSKVFAQQPIKIFFSNNSKAIMLTNHQCLPLQSNQRHQLIMLSMPQAIKKSKMMEMHGLKL